MPFHSKLINILRSKYTYILIINEGIGVKCERKNNTTLFSYFQIARKYLFMTNSLNVILTILMYDYPNIGSNLVVYIFRKGIMSLVRCDCTIMMHKQHSKSSLQVKISNQIATECTIYRPCFLECSLQFQNIVSNTIRMQNAPSTILSFKFSGSRPSYLAIPLIKSKRVLFFSLQYFTYSSFNYYFKYHQNVPFYRSCFQKYHENLDQPLRFVDTYSKFALIVYTTNVLQIARLILVPTLMFVLVLWCCVCIGGNWSSQ